LLLSLIGLVFTGELLEHLARWRVFQRVDELFILFPMIGNLKGNLEMCLSARLGTSANIGELDHRVIRRALLEANMILLGLQALLISCLAAVLSFVLGLLTVHRLGDAVGPGGNSTHFPGGSEGMDPGLAVGEQEWLEGYTRPGWKQLVMVLATGMGAAGLSSAVLGSFMSSMIVLCQWTGVDPGTCFSRLTDTEYFQPLRQRHTTHRVLPRRSPHALHPRPPRFSACRDDGLANPPRGCHHDDRGGGMVYATGHAESMGQEGREGRMGSTSMSLNCLTMD